MHRSRRTTLESTRRSHIIWQFRSLEASYPIPRLILTRICRTVGRRSNPRGMPVDRDTRPEKAPAAAHLASPPVFRQGGADPLLPPAPTTSRKKKTGVGRSVTRTAVGEAASFAVSFGTPVSRPLAHLGFLVSGVVATIRSKIVSVNAGQEGLVPCASLPGNF